MKILSIHQYEEINETICLNKTCPVFNKYTRSEWIEAYLVLIAPAGVDTFCESNIEDSNQMLLESNINENIFTDLRNILKGRKLIKAKYKGYDQAAKNYIAQSRQIKDMEVDTAIKDKKRIAVKKAYDNAIK